MVTVDVDGDDDDQQGNMGGKVMQRLLQDAPHYDDADDVLMMHGAFLFGPNVKVLSMTGSSSDGLDGTRIIYISINAIVVLLAAHWSHMGK